MKEVNNNWSLLPTEILSKIFQIVAEERPHNESNKIALVCKAWLHAAQLVLYSTDNIHNLPQLRNFYSTVENNAFLGEMVKAFHTRFRIREGNDTEKEIKLEVYNILSPLLSARLPNLEELSEQSLYSYTSTLDALLDCQLKRLKVLEMPVFECRENEIANYITCALLMRDRLENLLISDNYLFEEEISKEEPCFNRLYNKIHKFEKLRSVCIEKKANQVIPLLENVADSCKTLKTIELVCRPSDDESNNAMTLNSNIVSIDEISNLTPANNIELLRVNGRLSNIANLLLYIMHKFPQLRTLSLDMKMNTASTHLDDQIKTKLLKYFSNIENISVSKIKIDNTTITDIGNYWKTISTSISKRAEFTYKVIDSDELHTLLDFSKSNGSSISSANFTYFASDFSWRYMTGFMGKKGNLIRELQFAFEAKDIRTLPDNFIQFTFTHCFQLQILHLQHCCIGSDCSLYYGRLQQATLTP